MRKAYVKPSIEVERYTLDASIAANCQEIVTLGPGIDEYGTDVCKEFYGLFGEFSMFSSRGTSFYQSGGVFTCDCYYTSGGEGYFTS